jgi:anthranilate synthase component 1
VGRCRTHRSGDAFQIVISQRFSVPFVLPPSLYRGCVGSTRHRSCSFSISAALPVGSSPGVLVRLRDGTVTIRPLAAPAARHDARKIRRWRRNCCPTRRSGPSI